MAACAPGRQEIRASPPPIAAGDIITGIQEAGKNIHSLKGMASVKVAYNGKDTNVKELLVVKRPSQIRAETISLIGNPAFILALDGTNIGIYKAAENIFYKGDISSHEIPLPFPLNELGAEELANLLLGGTPLIKYGDSEIKLSESEKAYIITLRSKDGFKRQVISADAGTLRLMKSEIIDGERGMALSVAFSNYQDVDNIPFPKEIKIQFADKPDMLYIRYEDIELNRDVADELFVLAPP